MSNDLRAMRSGSEGTGRWLFETQTTPGAANVFALRDEIVINEIRYQHAPQQGPYVQVPEEWIELYNRSNHSVDLTGWRIDEGIDFTFAAGTTIAAGQYLVVAKDAAALHAKYPAITVVGNFSGSLGNSGDTVVINAVPVALSLVKTIS